MLFKLLTWLSYLALPFAVGQYVLRPAAYSLINFSPGLLVKSTLMLGYLGLTIGLMAFMAWELYRTSKGRQRAWVAVLAVAFLLTDPYRFVVRDIGLLTDLQRLDQLSLDPAEYRVRVSGSQLQLSGTVSIGMWQEVQAALAAHPNIQTIAIQSPGGRVSPAIAIADQIRTRGLDTQAEGRCFSACTLIFLAGENRSLGRFSQFGFHAAYRPGADGQRIPSVRINQAIVQRFVSRGVDPEFSVTAWTTPSNDLWLPSTDQLLSANYATDLL